MLYTTVGWGLYATNTRAKLNALLPPESVLLKKEYLVDGIWGAALWKGIATWLILPVVICLSQRLSHACVSINSFVL
jgi:hypothetical protein